MGEILIREALPEDAAKLIEYVDMVAGETDNLTFGTGEFGLSIEDEEKYLEVSKNTQNAVYFIALENDKIVGALSFSAGKRARISHRGEFGISVSKEYWGRGIGRSLINELIAWARNSSIIRMINLEVRADNDRAIILYKSCGFTIDGVVKRGMQVNGIFIDLYLMGLEID